MSPLLEQLQQSLGGTYRIERELGGGGMSRVFVATETALGRTVVIKVLPPELEGAVSAERFRREMLVVARLQHPMIVPLLTAGEAGGLLYYTMPFVEGTSLRAEIERDGKLPIARVTRILSDVLEALAYAHAKGVVHRDIKPENVLLATNHAVVTDFGVAKALALSGAADGRGMSTTGIAIGSPTYMAPEQAAGDPTTDFRADLYAVGVVGYEMLTGRTPFHDKTPSELLAARATERPVSVHSTRPETPKSLSELLMRLLEKAPQDRVASANVALGALAPAALASNRRSKSNARAAALLLTFAILAAAAAGVWRFVSAPTRLRGQPSIAVLPFRDLSPAHDNAYFSEGMAEELIHVLGKAGGLRVAGRASSFAFRGTDPDTRDIGRQLRVGALLEGSVQRSGDSLRVFARLVDTDTDSTIWSEQYDRRLKDVFAVQDELTAAIARELRVRLADGPPESNRAGTSDVEAYELYLRGRYFWNKRTPESLRHSINYFDSAIARDSRYARAYAGIADSYNVLGALGYLSAREAHAKGKAAALTALALDPNLAEAHSALGLIHMFYEWDAKEARKNFERSIALDPNYPSARMFYGFFFEAIGRPDSAVLEARRAHDLDPLSLIINLRLGDALGVARRYSEAIEQYRHTLELDSSFSMVRPNLAGTLVLIGELAEAGKEYGKLDRPGNRYVGGDRVLYYAEAGFVDSARTTLAALRRGAKNPALDFQLAIAYLRLEPRDSVFAALNRSVDAQFSPVALIAADPVWDELHGDPRWKALVRRMWPGN